MERKRQREIAMAAVAVAIVIVAAYRIRSTPAESGVPVAQTAAAQPPSARKDVMEVDLQALQAERPEPVVSARNPFRFTSTPPPPAASRPPAGSDTQAPAFDSPPPPPRIALKFIGVLDSAKTGRVAVLSDGRGVYQGREGETIEGRYRILKIGVESIDLAYVDGRGSQTIRLTGQ